MKESRREIADRKFIQKCRDGGKNVQRIVTKRCKISIESIFRNYLENFRAKVFSLSLPFSLSKLPTNEINSKVFSTEILKVNNFDLEMNSQKNGVEGNQLRGEES